MNLKESHIKNQTEYDLNNLIKELESKWESDKYHYYSDEARKFYSFITKLELDKGIKGQKINPWKFQFIHTSKILCVKSKETNL